MPFILLFWLLLFPDKAIALKTLSKEVVFRENVKSDKGGNGNPIEISDNYIDRLVYKTRRDIIKFHNMKKVDTNHVDFANKCINTSQEVFCNCINDSVKSNIMKIYAGYKRGNEIDNDLNCHYFNIVEYDGDYYLVDLTYAQFFTLHRNHLDRLGVPKADGCDVGIYMMRDEESKRIANEILTKGYIKLDDDVFKRYMDAFTLSFRNGLYYDNNNINNFDVEYTVSDYLKFLRGEDDQIKHEGIECLGLQKKPLKKNSGKTMQHSTNKKSC